MAFRIQKTSFLLIALLTFSPFVCFSAKAQESTYRVLVSKKTGLNLSSVEKLISLGDKAIEDNDLVKARSEFDKARILTKQMLGFYRDINGSFRGIDARIPKEMDIKGRKAQALLAKINLRLASLFRKQQQPEIAVPLLIEVIKLVTPARSEGQTAYQNLLELGFVDTPYAAMRNK
tara:strand:- start:1298 stop:1825 length:528 start_codon:yes stop_codon:yes gene_type:complete